MQKIAEKLKKREEQGNKKRKKFNIIKCLHMSVGYIKEVNCNGCEREC